MAEDPAPTLNVLQVVDSLALGGAERVAVNLANDLATHGYGSALCTTRALGPLEAFLSPDVGRLDLERRTRFDLKGLRRLRRYVRAHDIDIVHAHSTSLFSVVIALKFAPRVRIVWHDHYGAQHFSERPVLPYRLAASRTSACIVVSERLRKWVTESLRVPESRVFKIDNFISLPSDTSRQVHEARRTTGPRLVCVAAFRPQKDHRTLLEAFRLVAARHADASLVLVGGGPPKGIDEARTLAESLGISDRIEWLGERTDVAEILTDCDVGVLSSRSEAFPLVLLEYGAAGLSVVATKVGECAEILDDGRAGVLVPAADPEALARSLNSLVEAEERGRRALGENLRVRVMERYGPERALGQVVDVYRKVVGTR
jgi:glycosyltransferase involved in cell wall biosynthesis